METEPPKMRKVIFDLSDNEYQLLKDDGTSVVLAMTTNIARDLPILLRIDTIVAPKWYGIVTGGLILMLLYFFIIFDILHRTFAAMIASSLGVAALSFTDNRPSLQMLVGFIEAETLLLLFSMMILVSIIAKTGLFDYAAVLAYKVCKNKLLRNNNEHFIRFLGNWWSSVAIN